MRLRCMLVDDSPAFLASASALLTQQGLVVVGRAQDALSASALVGTVDPDVVLVDVELGPDDGVELARSLAAQGLAGRVVLISQRDAADVDIPEPSSGVAGFIRKDELDAHSVDRLITSSARRTSRNVPPARRADPAVQLNALRRVAAEIARGAEPTDVFRLVAHEVSDILGIRAIGVFRCHHDSGMVSKLYGTHGDRSAASDGASWPIEFAPAVARMIRTGRPVRHDDWLTADNVIAERHRAEGFGETLAAPIMIDGEMWGGLSAFAELGQDVPDGCEDDLADFTNLIAGAVANIQTRSLATAQAALRRVATVVADGAEPDVVFTTVAHEASAVLGLNAVSLIRYDAASRMLMKIYGTHGRRSPIADGTTWPLEDSPESEIVVRTGQPSRVDDWSDIPGPAAAGHRAEGFGGSIAAPIVVDGTIWGVLAAYAEGDQILAPNCENDLADFTNLMASAIANAQTRDELRGLAERQGEALRRVATLVGQRAPSATIFDAVASEAQRALGVGCVDVCRTGPEGSSTLVGSTMRGSGTDDGLRHDAVRRIVREVATSNSPARTDDLGKQVGFACAVAAPIRVDGGIWGVVVVLDHERLADDVETRLADFTHLVASSIANVNARDDLIASRSRIVTASDDTRRRIERNLHDGVQQRTVALALQLRTLRMQYPLPPGLDAGLDDIMRNLDELQDEIRTFSQGLHPALLARSGLSAALRGLVRRSVVPVELQVDVPHRCAEPIETAVYYAVSEALANAAKHAAASVVTVSVLADAECIRARVTDDGRGGATRSQGSGLTGLADRVEAAGGRMSIDSPVGQGTTVAIEIPLTQVS